MGATRIPDRSRLDRLVGANRTACTREGPNDIERGRVRNCRMLRLTHGIVLPADCPPRFNPTRYRLACTRCRYVSAAWVPGTALPLHTLSGSVAPAVDCRSHLRGHWPAAALHQASGSSNGLVSLGLVTRKSSRSPAEAVWSESAF